MAPKFLIINIGHCANIQEPGKTTPVASAAASVVGEAPTDASAIKGVAGEPEYASKANFPLLWRIVDFVVAALMIIGAILMWAINPNASRVIVGILLFLLAVLLLILQFKRPARVVDQAKFLFNPVGRGILYIVVGLLLCGGSFQNHV